MLITRQFLLFPVFVSIFALSACLSGSEAGSEEEVSTETAREGLTGVAACNVANTGTCTTSADCASGLCLQRHSGRICTTTCNDSQPCATGMECEWRHTGAGLLGYCVPKTRGWTP
jgi:hypothetical protein